MSLDHLFDHKQILKNTPNKDSLSVTLKKGNKGVSLFAQKDIQKGDIIAHYKMMVFTDRKKQYTTDTPMIELCDAYRSIVNEELPERNSESTYQYKKKLIQMIDKTQPFLLFLKNKKVIPPKGDMYHFSIYNKNGYEYKNLTGDLYKGSLPNPKDNIPYWGYFANEASCTERPNADISVKNDKKSVKEGDTITYSIVAESPIKKGEEIMWSYGSDYNRSYPTSCNKKSCLKKQ
jgi:hypothetical protein